MNKKIIIIKLFVLAFTAIYLSGCKIDTPCDDAVQLPVPSINILVVNSVSGKTKFKVSTDTNYYNPDSVAVFVGNKFKIDFTKPFKTEKDSLIHTDQWIWIDYYTPRLKYVYLQYRKNKLDSLYIDYSVFRRNCGGKAYANYTINHVYMNGQEIIPSKNIYKIIK